MDQKKVLLLFSGGRDSFLAACKLIEEGYKTYMITFENGAGVKAKNAEHGANRIIKRYGKENVNFLGVRNISGIWRYFIFPYYNLRPSEIITQYGELPVSQFHCLSCRSAMYIWSIIKANQMNIKYIADGARQDQGFAIELPNMIHHFKKMFSEYSLELLLPVYELDDDWKRKNLLLIRGFVPKTLEPQCLLGVPLPNNLAPDNEIINAVEKFFTKIILPSAREIINTQSKAILDSEELL